MTSVAPFHHMTSVALFPNMTSVALFPNMTSVTPFHHIPSEASFHYNPSVAAFCYILPGSKSDGNSFNLWTKFLPSNAIYWSSRLGTRTSVHSGWISVRLSVIIIILRETGAVPLNLYDEALWHDSEIYMRLLWPLRLLFNSLYSPVTRRGSNPTFFVPFACYTALNFGRTRSDNKKSNIKF